MPSPVITVLMPLYNAEEYLQEAITSVLGQTFRDFELLIVDDSNDGSYKIASGIADPRIRIIRNDPPLGLRKSSNLGIRNAKGKYIARMEADDIALPQRLEKQFRFMEMNPSVSVCGSYLEVFGNEKGVWKYPLEHDEIRSGLIWGITIGHPSSFMRRSFLVENNFFYKEEGFPYAEDWEFFYNMRNKAVFANLGEVLQLYRKTRDSVTKRMRPNREKIMTEMYTRVLSEFGIAYSDEEMLLHQFLVQDFAVAPSPDNIGKARKWLLRLMRFNEEKKTYPSKAFNRNCEELWKRLFYPLTSYGFRSTAAYFKNSPEVRTDHISYYLKHSLNKMIGRRA